MTSSVFRIPVQCAAMLAPASATFPADAATRKEKAAEPEHFAFDLPMRVVIVRNNVGKCEPLCPQWISAEGQITANTPSVFNKALAAPGDQNLPVIISSPGGDVEAALAIGEIIRK